MAKALKIASQNSLASFLPRPNNETGGRAFDDLVRALDAQILTMKGNLASRTTATGTILPSAADLLENLSSRLFVSVQDYMLYFTNGRTCFIDPTGASKLLGYAPTEEMLSRFLSKIVAESYDQE